jgi:hypothetical protein
VWVIDDGEKIRRDATSTPFERGEENPVWRPGAPVRLFALRNEVVALQVVVEAGDALLAAVTVDVSTPAMQGGDALQRVTRFVEHFVQVRRASGGATAGESIGWEPGAGPERRAWTGPVPDALIPVERAPDWATYPLAVEAHTNGIVWIDVDVPPDQRAGLYRGAIDVEVGAHGLASIPLEIDVNDGLLPEAAAEATVFADPDELTRRVGPGAEEALWMLLHAHRVSPLHDATSPTDVARQAEALSGALYDGDRGYVGAGARRGDGVLAIGAYGALGDPDTSKLARVEAIVDAAAAANVLEGTDVFVYSDDERCTSRRGAAWRQLLRGSGDPRVRGVRVAWTCSEDPSEQPVDIPILLAHYDSRKAAVARSRGKEVWVYNGVLPRTGTFLLDADAVSPRVNGWLAGMFGIRRWFYWEATYWYGAHGASPVDPFAEAETLHNDDGDWANGDGVLVYPGRQIDAFGAHSLGYLGVLPSIRLKNWRRGLQDAAYLELARRRDAARADAIARALIPAAFDEARRGRPASWSGRGLAFFEARRALLAVATERPAPVPATTKPGARLSGYGLALGALALGLLGLYRAARGARLAARADYLERPLRLGITRMPRPSSHARSSMPQRAAE